MVFLYYVGHGIERNFVNAVIEDAKVLYPIERELRALAKEPDIFVLAVLDCTRVSPTEAMALPKAEKVSKDSDPRNCIISYSCEPKSDVDARPTDFALNYFKKLL